MPFRTQHKILNKINDIKDLRSLSDVDLKQLAADIRSYLIQSVSETGGHFAANLGTIELTIALHNVYNTPEDILVWDVGHQTYPHKILTGRKDRMSTLRKINGLSGFPKRTESIYDSFGAGHSSTSISAALGMAIAEQAKGSNAKVVAIIGDGAMSAGMAFEALNHAGDLSANLLVVLNDNEMSISPNVGGLSNYLARILSSKLYYSMREGSKKVLKRIPGAWEVARRAEEHMKGMVVPGTLFEELGFNYIGPIDGHDLSALIPTLTNIRSLPGPQFLHVITKKGKGYAPAEENPCSFHGVSKFDPFTGKSEKSAPGAPTYTEVCSQWICDMAKQDKRLVAITPAMREGSGLVNFSQQFPDRYYDVGIAEQHAVTLAAGMACGGLKPVVAIYSTFLQRAMDQLIHDVAIQNLDVTFAIDRAGIVGPDEPTHSGTFDLSLLRAIPNMIIMAPSNENECRQMLTTGYEYQGPAAIRYPRERGVGVTMCGQTQLIPIGTAEILRKGKKIAILAFGTTVAEALKAGDAVNATVVNMRFVKPLDERLVSQVALDHELLISIEDNALNGGAGSAISEFLHQTYSKVPLICIGVPDQFLDQAERSQLIEKYGIDSKGIINSIENYYHSHDCQKSPSQLVS